MKTVYSLVGCISLMFCGAAVWAQDAAATRSLIDVPGLKKILDELGYAPELKKNGDNEYLQIEMKHSNGEMRKHLVGIDPQAATLFILGGGFSWTPDPKKASNEWFRKLLRHNNNLAPSYIFLNDTDVFGLTTVIGNVDVNAEKIKAKLKDHLANFDEKLVPLINELPGAPKEDGDSK